MCKVGDIIIIQGYLDNGKRLSRHSFVVISDEEGEIKGVPYDFIANVLSSFKNSSQRAHKLNYPGNMEITSADTVTQPDNGKDGYIKTDQLYYFNKNKISYQEIGTVNSNTMDAIFKFIENGTFPITNITDNL